MGEDMILLITPSARGQECAQALLAATTLPTQAASTLQAAIAKLREQEYSAVVIDQCLMEAEPDDGEVMLQHLGSSFPVYVNCAISGIERVVREVRSALSRRIREEEIARASATRVIWSELKESVTAILLSCDLVLASKDVSAPMAGKIQVIHDLATRMRGTLAPSEECDPTS
jgi:DNA-binding NtrC family response regulator